jgi:hypothetical protein
MAVAIVIIAIASVASGGLIAATATYWRSRQTQLEEFGGTLFVLGLVLLGAAFPAI